MAGSKRKTTMAKLNRERKLLEKRAAKQAKKEARKRAAAEGEPEVGQFASDEVAVERPPDEVAVERPPDEVAVERPPDDAPA
jgi:hypothetical protein